MLTASEGAKRQTATVTKERGAKRLRKVCPSEAAAPKAATAAKAGAGRQPRSLELTLALGCADLYPERRVAISGFRLEIDAVPWLVEEVSHSLAKDRGFTTAIRLEAL